MACSVELAFLLGFDIREVQAVSVTLPGTLALMSPENRTATSSTPLRSQRGSSRFSWSYAPSHMAQPRKSSILFLFLRGFKQFWLPWFILTLYTKHQVIWKEWYVFLFFFFLKQINKWRNKTISLMPFTIWRKSQVWGSHISAASSPHDTPKVSWPLECSFPHCP